MKILLLSILISIYMHASVVGTVSIVKGNIKVKSENSIKKSKVKSGLLINSGDMLITYSKASVVIKLIDGSQVIVDAKSTILFKNSKNIEQKDGKVYYNITSRSAKNALQIKTSFAIIGIKGTKFVVNTTEKSSVTLKEGLIGVTSIIDEFELYRKAVRAEYNKYANSQMQEFEKYKNSNYQKPIKTKNFDLKAGNRISFNKTRVNEDNWNEKDDAEFAYFEAILGKKYSKKNKKLVAKVDDSWDDADDAEFDAIEALIDANR